MLTHSTASIETILGILKNGFAWVPNRRDLMPLLVSYRMAEFGEVDADLVHAAGRICSIYLHGI
jgi:hypothetical protein